MPRQRSQVMVAKALFCFFLLLTAMHIPLEGQARFASALAYGASNSLALSANLSTQRRRARRKTSRKSRAGVNGRSYINVEGVRVPSPRHSQSAPEGATAQYRDGTYSFSRNRRGTCSHHGGVARWL
jgi:hypothetical protein